MFAVYRIFDGERYIWGRYDSKTRAVEVADSIGNFETPAVVVEE